MNSLGSPSKRPQRSVLVLAIASVLVVAGCGSTPKSPAGAAEVRDKLSRMQADPNLAGRVPSAQTEAERAVALAEQPLRGEDALGAHRVYLADRKVDIAIARSTTVYTEAQRETLGARQAEALLDARTREANAAQRDADRSRDQAYSARDDAERARQSARADAARSQEELGAARSDAARSQDELGAARSDAERAQREARSANEREAAFRAQEQVTARETARLQQQISDMQAERTERGLVLTLGDLLFATGSADLKTGSVGNLDRLIEFLAEYPERNVEIEGHTDAVGDASYNQTLSERRAASIKTHLVQRGIGSERIVTRGKGLNNPRVANAADGSQALNRRVEVIILEPGVALPTSQRSW